MTLSFSPFVRLAVCAFVRPPFFSLVSLKSVVHLECHRASKSVKGTQWESLCVSRVFQGSFKGISRKFQECFKEVKGSFKEVSRVFQGCFKGVSRKFQGCFKEVSRVFQGSFKSVSSKF